jgi:hypothetical protein
MGGLLNLATHKLSLGEQRKTMYDVVNRAPHRTKHFTLGTGHLCHINLDWAADKQEAEGS